MTVEHLTTFSIEDLHALSIICEGCDGSVTISLQWEPGRHLLHVDNKGLSQEKACVCCGRRLWNEGDDIVTLARAIIGTCISARGSKKGSRVKLVVRSSASGYE